MKPYAMPDAVMKSLIALRDELWLTTANMSVNERIIFYKINSCLYSKYPVETNQEAIDYEYR